jgi:hypothetical protein
VDVLEQTRALRERSRQLILSFISADVDYGYTLCRLAKRTPERSTERLRPAQTVLDTATTFMWKTKLEPNELDELTAKIERLKFELKSVEAELAQSNS